jgi:capsid assembly protease
MPKINAADVLQGIPWAIQPGYLQVIHEIASRENDSIEAVEKRIGRPLSNIRLATQRGNVAIIPVTGPIMRYASFFSRISGATSIQELALDFQNALDNPDISTILFEMDSPGGAVSGVQEFAEQVYAARGQKNIIAYASGMMASAAYWIGSAADTVYVSKTAIVGSIGVVTTLQKGQKEGEIEIVSSQSPNKRPNLETEEGVASVQVILDDLASVFIEAVSRNREVTADQVVSDFGAGGVFVGKKAVRSGLADGMGEMEALIEKSNLGKLKGAKTKRIAASSEPEEIEMSITGDQTMTDENKTPAVTREFILANHGDIAEGFRAEGFTKGKEAGFAEGLEAGAKNERDRVSGLEAAFDGFAHHGDLLAKFKADGTTTGDQAATHILAAEREKLKNKQAALHEDGNQAVASTPQVNIHTPEADDKTDPKAGPVTKEKAKEIWESDASVQKEFTDAETYYYFRKNQ